MQNNFIFFGTPDVAAETLEILYTNGFTPTLIITAPDRPSGRGMHMTSCDTKKWADDHNIPTLQPEKITPDVVDMIAKHITDHQVTASIVVAYGKILPERLIQLPVHGTYNIHYSLLPRWRGASPVESAILHGDTETGISIQKMVYQLDAGNIINEEKLVIEHDDTTLTLRAKLINLGGKNLVTILPDILQGKHLPETVQDEQFMTHCGKFTKQNGELNIENDTPETLWRKYRALAHNPGVFIMKNGEKIKIKNAIFENGRFIIKRVTYPGKPESDY